MQAAASLGPQVSIEQLRQPARGGRAPLLQRQANRNLIELGLQPHLLRVLIDSIFDKVEQFKHRVKLDCIHALVNSRRISNALGTD